MTRRGLFVLCLAGLLLAGTGCTAELPAAEPEYTVAYHDGQEGPAGWMLVVTPEQWNALGKGRPGTV